MTAKTNCYTLLIALFLVGCVYHEEFILQDCGNEGPVLTLIEKQNSNCNDSDGRVVLEGVGGSGSYIFSSSLSEDQLEGTFDALQAGNYRFTVTDSRGCFDEIEVAIENTSGVRIDEIDIIVADCGSSFGQITITASRGIRPYVYSLNNGEFDVDSVFQNLSVGNYTVTVRDANECIFNQEATIANGTSFNLNISPIISSSCAIDACHNGNQFPDFRVFENVKNSASLIKSFTTSGFMPQDGTLTQTQINQIACWVDDGALEN